MSTAAGTGQGESPPSGERLLAWGGSPRALSCYALTALLALLAGLAALGFAGVTPFGEATLCWQDNGQQVASDFGYVRGVVEGRHSLTWSYACGGSPRSCIHPTFNNLCSPLTWAVAAVPGISAVTGLSLLFLLQLSLLPLGVLCYLRNTFPRLPTALGMALALAYAFGGFVLTKYTFLPFLNVAILFPWYVAALDALLRRGRWVPCCLLLTLILAVGTCFAWMWLLFTAVYATARAGWRWRSPLRQHTLLLFQASLVALLLSSYAWLPSLIVTALSARAGEAHFWWHATRVEMVAEFVGGLVMVPPALLALLLWRFPRRWSRYALTLLVLLVGLACVSATTLWHLSRPWDFAGRFAYMAELMVICLLAQSWCRSARRPMRWGALRLGVAVLLAGAAGVALWYRFWELSVVLFGTLVLMQSWARHALRCGLLLTAALGSFALWLSMDWDIVLRKKSYQASAHRVQLAEWAARQVPQPEGRVTSRGNAAVENLAFFTPFDSLSHFTACITAEQERTLARWGYQQRTAVISTEGGTLATDTLLGMRYILSQASDAAPYHLAENPYYFGVGMMMPEGTLPLPAEAADPMARQQALLTRLLGAEHAGTLRRVSLWEPLSLPQDNLYYLAHVQDGIALCFEGWPYERWMSGVKGSYAAVESLPELVELPARTTVWSPYAMGVSSCLLYELPRTSLAALQAYGRELPVRCTYAGTRMSIACRSTEARNTLFLPLLWQLCYKATVDGQPARVQCLDGFVGIRMPQPGEHRVELVYEPVTTSAFLWAGLSWFVGLLMARRHRWSPGARAVYEGGNTCCYRLLLVVSAVLLLWPLAVLPLGMLWS